MEFFQALPLEIKVVLGAIVAVAVLAVFNHNRQADKYYVIVLVLLAAGGVYRYQSTKPVEKAVIEEQHRGPVTTPEHRPLQTAR